MTPRRQLLRSLVLIALVLSLFTACGAPRQPLAFSAPWADGEISRYDVLARDGAIRGTAAWTMRSDGAGWMLSHELSRNGKVEKGEVAIDEHLRPLRSFVEGESGRTEATYGADAVALKTTPKDGPVKEESVPRAADALDNEAVLALQRALPLGPGYRTRYTDVVPKSGAAVPVELDVIGEESITVPAGTFATWRLSMHTGLVAQEAWVQKDAPHLLVKYENPASGAVFALRSWRSSTGDEVHGIADPPRVEPPPSGPIPINYPFLVASVFVQWPLMMIFPLLLARYFAKRYGYGWRLWGAGALTFVLSQVVHLPLNWALGMLGKTPRGLGLLPLPLFALAAGLSAGLCEEIARYLMLRFGWKRARSFQEALQFGTGHGGMEALLLGLIVIVSFAAMLVLRVVPLQKLGIQGDAASQVADAMSAFWQSAWYTPILGGLERVFAIASHIGMTVLVMRAVARRRPAYLLAAIAAHTVLDAVAVWSMRTLGMIPTEAIIAVFAIGFVAMTYAMREDPPREKFTAG